MNTVLSAATAPDIAVFVCAAVLVMAGAFGVVLLRNPVHCALSLVMTLFGIAVTFIAQDAQFLAAVQVIVYAGAIVVLFLFVIMLLGVDRADRRRHEGLIAQRPLGVLLGFAILGLVVSLAGWSWDALGGRTQSAAVSSEGSNIEKLADSIFTTYLFPFEATSVLLVIAVVGAVVLARRPESEVAIDAEPDGDDDRLDGAGDDGIDGSGSSDERVDDPVNETADEKLEGAR